ncbi:cAMP-dependent protein kinase type I-beta regulatory subunit, putative [Theileria equi strain WA]|uniref:cAMP-dependent protein kinase type I-beta regulatory subunit, putative n=1 Tax=Theileria equi strain WA TaxID=1537102 RepID=L0AUX5_THEEQ|nr:cAMP-dependent protein kinase type I-beta regulatory subunit, putative [Theileria equi strain WA]AFZ79397.1 cAMP-dependent protein kinase type I-beta regulatory subunit, putative [Theileria equi strain WA]|eukprot:XP_004829063.1 cAMP-dependent protein kinase type I-beta regulatory subunit, putative [Theileria equi strain WA]
MADVESHEFDQAIKIARSRQRFSVSAEVFGEHNLKGNFVAPVHEKTAEEEAKIRSIIVKCFLFSSLSHADLDVLVKAFDFQNASAGDVIIKQGDDGDKLFIIESGSADFTKKSLHSEEVKFLCTMDDGQYFGELALMYNTPRAATVVAKTDMRLWTLDRGTFNHIVRDAVVKKRERYDKLLSNVSLLAKVDPYDRCRLADALIEKTFNDEVIIQEGDAGTSLFMILEGKAEAYCQGKLVKSYSKDDYFGEIALIKQTPRASTVKAKGQCIVCELERESVINLLGPLEEVLAKNIKEYKKVLAELGISNIHLRD